MTNRVKFLSYVEANQWYITSNLFVKSLISFKIALKQFNDLTIINRKEIIEAFNEYDKLRNLRIHQKLDENEMDDAFFTSIMVDAHIIATEFNMDPLAATMCINPPCKINEKVIVK